ncbi:MAG: hypothetical protein GEU81_02500 [Nitriliruptorales bacterium]|nr:hypothetical protein [Nitriliruptorales bacterium]
MAGRSTGQRCGCRAEPPCAIPSGPGPVRGCRRRAGSPRHQGRACRRARPRRSPPPRRGSRGEPRAAQRSHGGGG